MPWGSLPFQNCIHPRKVVRSFFSSAFLSVRMPGFLSLDGTLNVSSTQEYCWLFKSGKLCFIMSYHLCDKVQYGFCEWAWVARGDKVRCLAGNYHVLRAKYTSPAGGTRVLTFLEQDIPHATISSPESLSAGHRGSMSARCHAAKESSCSTTCQSWGSKETETLKNWWKFLLSRLPSLNWISCSPSLSSRTDKSFCSSKWFCNFIISLKNLHFNMLWMCVRFCTLCIYDIRYNYI